MANLLLKKFSCKLRSTGLMSDNVSSTSDSKFDTEVISSDLPVVVDFWAPWCPPCKAIAPILEELATEFAGKIKIIKLNIDENPRTPANYKVRGIPNLVFFKGGKVVDQLVGAVPKEELVKVISQKLL
jgi:thioredoxin 1